MSQRSSRVYNPVLRSTLRTPVPSDILSYDRFNEISRFGARGGRVAIFIDGGCSGNGLPWARAAFGVYFARNSPYNLRGILPQEASHTSQAAEIFAAQQAVNSIRNNLEFQVWEDGVVLVTDSDYLFRSITSYVHTWVTNDFVAANGRPVVNAIAMWELHRSICDLEARGIAIQFWRVGREHNQDADNLANAALVY